MALEIIIKSSHQISLEFFWVVSTVSNAIGLLIGNLKPKPVELSAIDKNLLAQIKKKRKYKILLTNDKDESIIYQSYAFIFLFIGVWIYILNTTINTKLTLLKESFAFEALLAFVCYGIALNITYRKEKV
ncbi:hypothetical protein GCM10028810_54500 [Spirosoma litoris]